MSFVGKCVECHRLFHANERNRGTLSINGKALLLEMCDQCQGRRVTEQKHAQMVATGRPA